MDTSINGPTKLNPVILKYVWFESDDALPEGGALCYNRDYGTITDSDARRVNHVEPPTTDNAQWFAGVSAKAYSAHTGGQLVEIYCPGSVCNILVAVTTVRNQGLLTFDLTSGVEGQFLRTGMPGRGSAIPLQTVTYDATALVCQALLLDGVESGGVELVAAAVGAIELMVGGTSLITGADLTANDCTEEVLDGLVEGIVKKVALNTILTGGNGLVVSIENTDGVKLAGTALASVELAQSGCAVGDHFVIVWESGAWVHKGGKHYTEA